ncbi:MAG TPA: hypothetical protein VEQ37_16585 [Actinomycetota bacterium]|nr:hypothetical protein [Actinomycetota bacterium]
MAMEQATSPVQFSVDYPDRSLNRLTTGLRIFVAIPILILLGTVSGSTWAGGTHRACFAVSGAGGILFVGPLLMIPLYRNSDHGLDLPI